VRASNRRFFVSSGSSASPAARSTGRKNACQLPLLSNDELRPRRNLKAKMSCNINGIEVTTCNRLDILQQMMKTIMAVDHDTRMQKAKVRQRMVELQRKAGGGPKRKEEGKSKNFASEADFVKQSLLLWVQNKTASNSYVNVKDFSRSWADGMAFAALVSHFCPGKIPIDKLTPQTRRENFQYAFKVADDEFGVYPLLDVEDMVAMDAPDWKSVFAYVQIMYQAMKGKDPEV